MWSVDVCIHLKLFPHVLPVVKAPLTSKCQGTSGLITTCRSYRNWRTFVEIKLEGSRADNRIMSSVSSLRGKGNRGSPVPIYGPIWPLYQFRVLRSWSLMCNLPGWKQLPSTSYKIGSMESVFAYIWNKINSRVMVNSVEQKIYQRGFEKKTRFAVRHIRLARWVVGGTINLLPRPLVLLWIIFIQHPYRQPRLALSERLFTDIRERGFGLDRLISGMMLPK